MLYNKILDKSSDTDAAMVLSIIFGLLIGAFVGGIFAPNHHTIGIILSLLVGFFFVLMIVSENTDIGVCIMLVMPTISLTVFEIIFEISTKTLMYPWWVYGIILVVVTEILFFLDKTQPNTTDKDKVMWFNKKRKIEALIEASILLVILKLLRREFTSLDISIYYPILIDILVGILGIISIALLTYIFIWINSFRYKKV